MSKGPLSVDAEDGFTYSLAALLRQRCMEFDQLKEELARVRERVATRTRALETQAAQVQALEDTQREASQSGLNIDVSWRLRLHDCVRVAQVRHAEYASEVERAQADQQSAIEKVRLARLAVRANERHRERALVRFKGERERGALRAADELYLATLWPDGNVGSGSER